MAGAFSSAFSSAFDTGGAVASALLSILDSHGSVLMRQIKKGSTDQSVVIRIVDSGDGTPETGVEHNSSGIDLWYRREGAAKTSITEAALSALTDAHSDGGIEHIGDGYYRLDLPDAAFATGANGVVIGGTVTGMVVIGCYVHLTDYDPQDTVRLGMTALPNAAADGPGGLPISDAGGLDLDAKIGALTYGTANRVNVQVYGMEANVMTAAAAAADFGAELQALITGGAYALSTDANGRIRIVDGTGTGEIDTTSGKVNALLSASDVTGNVPANAIQIGSQNVGLSSDNRLRVDVAEWNDTPLSTTNPLPTVAPGSGNGLPTYNTVQRHFALALRKDAAVATDLFSILSEINEDHGSGAGAYSNQTEALEALRDRGDAAWITATGFSTHSAADVWAVATRVLTAIDEDSTTLDLDATIRAAVGLAAADLDTQLDAIPTANEIRNAVTGGAYAIDTDANGRVRIVDGTGAGELDTTSGLVKISGTIQTLDALDTAQDVEHDATQAAIAALSIPTVAQILTTQMTESYAADTVAPTLAQALFAIHQMLMEFSITGTTYQVKRLDGSTNAFAGVLNDATNPTALSRAA